MAAREKHPLCVCACTGTKAAFEGGAERHVQRGCCVFGSVEGVVISERIDDKDAGLLDEVLVTLILSVFDVNANGLPEGASWVPNETSDDAGCVLPLAKFSKQ